MAEKRPPTNADFTANSVIKRDLPGSFVIRCRKRLWEVSAPDAATGIREAAHYFAQYWADGEYDG